MSNINMNDSLRRKIMGITKPYKGDICDFKDLKLKTLNKLIENDFVYLELRQNQSPTVREYWELLKKYPDEPITLHGYIVSPERNDYRISIEGLEGYSGNESFLHDYMSLLARYPMGLHKEAVGRQYCWYD